jgi:cytochrome c556
MKLLLVLLFAAFTVFAALPTPQEEQDLVAAMKSLPPTQGSLKKNIESKNPEGVKSDAAKVEAAYKTTEDFWTKRNTQDAIEWSQAGKAAAAEIGKLAEAGEWEKIPEVQKKLQTTCAACHTAHREKLPEGGYKIK